MPFIIFLVVIFLITWGAMKAPLYLAFGCVILGVGLVLSGLKRKDGG